MQNLNRKTLILVLSFLSSLLMASASMADRSGGWNDRGYGDRPHRGHDGGQARYRSTPNFEYLSTRLQLTEEQTEEFIGVMTEQYEKYMQLKDELRTEMLEKMQQQREETITAVGGILKEDQITQLEAILDRRGKRFSRY